MTIHGNSEVKGYRKKDGEVIFLTPKTKAGMIFVEEKGPFVRLMNLKGDEMRIQNRHSNSPYDDGFWSEWVKTGDFVYLRTQGDL